jgi:hypothetical protein
MGKNTTTRETTMKFTPFFETRRALRSYEDIQRYRVFELCDDFDNPWGEEGTLIGLYENALQNVLDACGSDDRAYKWMRAVDRKLCEAHRRQERK